MSKATEQPTTLVPRRLRSARDDIAQALTACAVAPSLVSDCAMTNLAAKARAAMAAREVTSGAMAHLLMSDPRFPAADAANEAALEAYGAAFRELAAAPAATVRGAAIKAAVIAPEGVMAGRFINDFEIAVAASAAADLARLRKEVAA